MERPVELVPVEAMMRFSAAEARVYPMALADPEGYERATVLVAAVADELRRSCAEVSAVLQRRAELIAMVPGLAADAGLGEGELDDVGFPPETIVDAASAVRCRELGAAGPGR
jgi:hypothetical protein